jgi:hypothetical protein
MATRMRWSNTGSDFVHPTPRTGAYDSLEPVRRAKPSVHVHVHTTSPPATRRTHDASPPPPLFFDFKIKKLSIFS